MVIETVKETKATLLWITGRIDAITAPEFETTMNELLAAGETVFVIDFGRVDFISSAGLRSLLATAKLLAGRDGQLHLVNLSETVHKVISISGLSTIFQIHPSTAAALAQIP